MKRAKSLNWLLKRIKTRHWLRQLARYQVNLGSMGVPIKVSAEGKTAYLCCKGCNKDFDKDPKAVFAKLGK
jgi:hypothetical protein